MVVQRYALLVDAYGFHKTFKVSVGLNEAPNKRQQRHAWPAAWRPLSAFRVLTPRQAFLHIYEMLRVIKADELRVCPARIPRGVQVKDGRARAVELQAPMPIAQWIMETCSMVTLSNWLRQPGGFVGHAVRSVLEALLPDNPRVAQLLRDTALHNQLAMDAEEARELEELERLDVDRAASLQQLLAQEVEAQCERFAQVALLLDAVHAVWHTILICETLNPSVFARLLWAVDVCWASVSLLFLTPRHGYAGVVVTGAAMGLLFVHTPFLRVNVAYAALALVERAMNATYASRAATEARVRRTYPLSIWDRFLLAPLDGAVLQYDTPPEDPVSKEPITAPLVHQDEQHAFIEAFLLDACSSTPLSLPTARQCYRDGDWRNASSNLLTNTPLRRVRRVHLRVPLASLNA